MRLWSLSLTYLDRQGLLACWREALLAQKVLLGKTKGYKNHPQLKRFKREFGQYYIIWYLEEIRCEAKKRGYNFNIFLIKGKLRNYEGLNKLSVTNKQIEYEFKHLQKKLQYRNIEQYTTNLYSVYDKNMNIKKIKQHPLFKVIKGEIESWEKVKENIK